MGSDSEDVYEEVVAGVGGGVGTKRTCFPGTACFPGIVAGR